LKGNHLKKKKVNATEIARLAGVSQSLYHECLIPVSLFQKIYVVE